MCVSGDWGAGILRFRLLFPNLSAVPGLGFHEVRTRSRTRTWISWGAVSVGESGGTIFDLWSHSMYLYGIQNMETQFSLDSFVGS